MIIINYRELKTGNTKPIKAKLNGMCIETIMFNKNKLGGIDNGNKTQIRR